MSVDGVVIGDGGGGVVVLGGVLGVMILTLIRRCFVFILANFVPRRLRVLGCGGS
jgi:hypothetical protein